MNYFITTFFKFLLCLVPVYLTCLVIFYHTGTTKFIPNVVDKTKNDGFLLSRIQEIPNYKNVDYLFLGSSHTYRGLDPRIFENYGFTSFNLGSSAQTPVNSEILLTKYEGDLNPKNIIFEVYFSLFSNDGIESALEILGNSEIDRSSLFIALSDKNLIVYNTVSYILVNRLFHPIHKTKQDDIKTSKYIKGGYVEKIAPFNTNKKLSYSDTKKKISISSKQLNALIRIIEFSKNRNIKLTLVAAPVTRELISQYEDYPVFYEVIKNVADTYHVEYIDYNVHPTIIFNSNTDFYDPDHLSQKGVEKFNTHLIENYLLK